MRLWLVPLNVLVAALCIQGIAREHRPLGRFHSDNANWEGTLPAVLVPLLVTLGTYKRRVLCPGGAGGGGGGGGGVEEPWRRSPVVFGWLSVWFAVIGWLYLVQLGFYTFQFLKLQSLRWVVVGSCGDCVVPSQGPSSSSFTHGCWCTHSITHWLTHTNTLTSAWTILHTCPRLPLTDMHLFSKSLTQPIPHSPSRHPSFHSSNSLTGSHQFSSETNKCVTCQQSIIGPYDPCRSLYPFVHSAVLLSSPSCFPFIRRLSTHSLVQSVFPLFSVWSSCNPVLHSVQLV